MNHTNAKVKQKKNKRIKDRNSQNPHIWPYAIFINFDPRPNWSSPLVGICYETHITTLWIIEIPIKSNSNKNWGHIE